MKKKKKLNDLKTDKQSNKHKTPRCCIMNKDNTDFDARINDTDVVDVVATNPSTKRNDRSLRLKENHLHLETIVFSSLSGRFGVGFIDKDGLPYTECKIILNDVLQELIISTSKIIHRVSLIFNRLLIYLIENKISLPTFNQTFFNHIAIHGMRERILKKDTINKEFVSLYENEFNPEYNQFPPLHRQEGDTQAITYACNKYKTNFLNTIFVPFLTRQKKFILTWLKVNNIEGKKKSLFYRIQNKINGWNIRDITFTPEDIKDEENTKINKINEFIKEERKMLKNPSNLDDQWLKGRIHTVLLYYYHINQFYHQEGVGNKFRLAPLCEIKCQSLSVDDKVLNNILINVRKRCEKKNTPYPNFMKKIKAQDKTKDEVWKAVFNYDGLRKRRRFSHHVDTDGVKVCFHFKVTKKNINRRNRRQKHRVKKKSKNKEKQRIISIDPGRTNLITAYDNKKECFYTLTRRTYYRFSGMKDRIKKVRNRNLEMKGMYEALSQAPTRSIRDNDWCRYQMVLVRNYDKIWEFKTRKVWRKEGLRVAMLKEKCTDRFFNQFLIKGEMKPIVAYGASKISPTGRGEMSVPVKYIYEKCKRKFQTEKVDENYTTKMHYKCKGVTMKVIVGGKTIRGLRWCATCRELVSRDPNACRCIEEAYTSEERPVYLREEYERGEERPRRMEKVERKRKRKEISKFSFLNKKIVCPSSEEECRQHNASVERKTEHNKEWKEMKGKRF